MNEKFNKNAKVEKFTTMLGIAVRLIVIDPLKSLKQIWVSILEKSSRNKLLNFEVDFLKTEVFFFF